MKLKKVAITGFAESTMELVHGVDEDMEIWSVNFAWQKDLPRIDRLFELHKYEQIIGWTGENDVKHREWLMNNEDIPVYMQDVYPEFPGSVKFPFDEITEEIFKNIVFFDEEGNEKSEPYYTSTPAYMVGLAILEGFDIIELYGIDMSMGTEWHYQKACMEALTFFAAGRGIKIRLPQGSKLFKAPLYAYGTGQTVEKELLHLLKDRCEIEMEKQKDLFNSYRDQGARMVKENKPKSVIEDVTKEIIAAENMIKTIGGYIFCIDHLDKNVGIIGRQTLEKFKVECLQEQNKWNSHYNSYQGQIEALYEKGNQLEEMRELTAKAVYAEGKMRALSGYRQCLEHLITAIDIEEPEFFIKDEFQRIDHDKEQKPNGRKRTRKH